MHCITTLESIEGLPAGRHYCSDTSIAQIMALCGPGMMRVDSVPPCTAPQTWEGFDKEQLIICRPGKFGDLVLLTPCLRELKRRIPKTNLLVACSGQYRDALLNLPYIDGFAPYPIPEETARAGALISLEIDQHYADMEKELHMTDLFGRRLGLGEFEEKKPDYGLTKHELEWGRSLYPQKATKRVGVQIRAGGAARSYPEHQLKKMVRLFYDAGWEIFLFGMPGDANAQSIDRMTFCNRENHTFRQTVAIMASCDVMVGPDSSLIHVAGALDLPAIALYGPFPWQLRTAYSPSIVALNDHSGCDISPCFHTSLRGAAHAFPSSGPCAKTGFCTALAAIPPERILAKAERMVSG